MKYILVSWRHQKAHSTVPDAQAMLNECYLNLFFTASISIYVSTANAFRSLKIQITIFFLLSVICYKLNITIDIKIMKVAVYSNNLGT